MRVKIFSASTLNDELNKLCECLRAVESFMPFVFCVSDSFISDCVESFILCPLVTLFAPIDAVTFSLDVLAKLSLLLPPPDFEWSAAFLVSTSWLALLNVSLYLRITYKRWKYASSKFSKIDCTLMYKLICPKCEARKSISNFRISSMFKTFVSIKRFRNVANKALRILLLLILAGSR